MRPEHELPGAAGKRGVSTGAFPAKPLSPRGWYPAAAGMPAPSQQLGRDGGVRARGE